MDERITKRSRTDQKSEENPPFKTEERSWPMNHSVGKLFEDYDVEFDPVEQCLFVSGFDFTPSYHLIDPDFASQAANDDNIEISDVGDAAVDNITEEPGVVEENTGMDAAEHDAVLEDDVVLEDLGDVDVVQLDGPVIEDVDDEVGHAVRKKASKRRQNNIDDGSVNDGSFNDGSGEIHDVFEIVEDNVGDGIQIGIDSSEINVSKPFYFNFIYDGVLLCIK